jgi:hypothetical protein
MSSGSSARRKLTRPSRQLDHASTSGARMSMPTISERKVADHWSRSGALKRTVLKMPSTTAIVATSGAIPTRKLATPRMLSIRTSGRRAW